MTQPDSTPDGGALAAALERYEWEYGAFESDDERFAFEKGWAARGASVEDESHRGPSDGVAEVCRGVMYD